MQNAEGVNGDRRTLGPLRGGGNELGEAATDMVKHVIAIPRGAVDDMPKV